MPRHTMPLVFAALVLAAGCGGSSGSSKSTSDYTGAMQAIQQDPGGKTQALGAAMANPRLEQKRWRRAADLWLKEQHRALEDSRRIKPPSDVSALHARYVAETETWLAAMEDLVRSVERGEIPRLQLERRANDLGNHYAAQVGPIASEIEAKGYDAFQPFDSSN
jgi:hypothetical protein